MPRYLVSYDYRGFQWCEEITADSLRDADARLRHMGDGRVDGEVKLSLMFPRRGFTIRPDPPILAPADRQPGAALKGTRMNLRSPIHAWTLAIIGAAVAMALGKCVLG